MFGKIFSLIVESVFINFRYFSYLKTFPSLFLLKADFKGLRDLFSIVLIILSIDFFFYNAIKIVNILVGKKSILLLFS